MDKEMEELLRLIKDSGIMEEWEDEGYDNEEEEDNDDKWYWELN